MAVVFSSIAWPAQVVRRKYGVQATIPFAVYDSNSPWALYETAPGAADSFIVKNTKAPVTTTNAPSDGGKTHQVILTAAEMAAKYVQVIIQDQSSPALFGDELIVVETYGDANSVEPFDTSTATPTVNTTLVSGTTPAYAEGYGSINKVMKIVLGTVDDDPNAGSISANSKSFLTGNSYTRMGDPILDTLALDIAASSVSGVFASDTISGVMASTITGTQYSLDEAVALIVKKSKGLWKK
jgi:hypothetical protein